MMKRVSALVLAAGIVVGSYATDARVAVMGRQAYPWFYRDEISVFTNPADMSLYPNMIYGSFGYMDVAKDTGSLYYSARNNYPTDPHFGGLFSYRFTEEDNGPMFSVGVFLNRRDVTLDRLLKVNTGSSYGLLYDANNDPVDIPNLVDPMGKVDVLLGYDIGNGVALGLGAYVAIQNDKRNGEIFRQTEFYKTSLGLNWNIEQGLDLEAAVNLGISNAKYNNSDYYKPIPDSLKSISDGEYFLRGDVRFFSAVPAINGSFVPQVTLEYLKLSGSDIIDLNGGVGINMNIDRGFFWAGLQGVYTQRTIPDGSDISEIGARVSFGIERNIVWDWLLIRVGGKKELRYVTHGSGDNSEWWENSTGNGTDEDLVGLGFGINIDNRLRIDFVASESLPYTFTNLISGSSTYLFNRVSATYRF